MKINIITLFPEMFTGVFSESIISRAQKNKIVDINLINLRDFAEDKHKTVDDTPYGGGSGMVLKVDIMDRAIASIRSNNNDNDFKEKNKVILLSPQGKRFDQKKAREMTKLDSITLICGHYEGFDERIREHLVDEQISVGDFVLTGGEIPAMAISDSIIRLLPGVLGKDDSSEEESFSLTDENGNTLLEYPHYTRPAEYKGWTVPEVLQSGDHKKIKDWRINQAKNRSK